jgi:hypothetical protein
MALGVGRGQRRLADPTQSVQRGDRDPPLVALEPRLNRLDRILAPEEVERDGDRDIRGRIARLRA